MLFSIQEYTVPGSGKAGDPEREKRLIADLTRRRVVGIIVTPASEDHRALSPAALEQTPVVLVARPPSGIEGAARRGPHRLADRARRL
jgi:DNA-binding LacI/PurR family transcriptional regulator